MSCACFGGNGGGIDSCPCGTDDEGLGHTGDGDTEEGVCCTYGGDSEDACSTCDGDGEAVGGADVSFGALVFGDPSRDSLKLSSPSVKSKDGKN